MLVQELKPGVNVSIRFLQEATRADITGNKEDVKVFMSKIYDIKSDDTLELDMPTRGGKLLLLPQNVRYEFVFTTSGGIFKAEGTVVDRFKRGNFYLLKAKLTSKLEKHQRREYYRLNCLIPIVFDGLTDPSNEMDSDEAQEIIKEGTFMKQTADGTIVDISGGGMRVVSPTHMSDVSFCLLHFSLHFDTGTEEFNLLAKLIACTQVNDSSKYAYRFKFIFSESRVQERIIRYIFEEERRIRRKGQG
ncbi:MAG: flagellar brake domain-containing protein [Lachnospiraceae bacterium]|nr:flagellar brake domain-containing protein [Lachnospiraceae bacterium]